MLLKKNLIINEEKNRFKQDKTEHKMRLLSIDYLVNKNTFIAHNMLELFLRNKCLL